MEAKIRLLKKVILVLRIILVIEIICIVGFFIVDVSKGNCNDNSGGNMFEQTEKDTFNSTWESYAGENRTNRDVVTMISAVIANNASEKNGGRNHFIKVNGIMDTKVLSEELIKKYDNEKEKTFSIKPIYNDNDIKDYIIQIVINEEE